MGFQFLHIEGYARTSGKGKAGGHSIRTVAAEAGRELGACSHVENPSPPILRYGISADEAENSAEKWAETATDLRGHKLRKDGLCMVGGVISYPADGENWEKFRDESIRWLKNKYGNRLKSVVEHTDEPFRHFHFYVVPNVGDRFESIHGGRAAAQMAKTEGGLKGQQNAAYIEAMRLLQDEFSQKVAMRHGLTRLGPGRRRLTRAAWNEEKKQAKFFANTRAHYKYAKKKGYEAGKAEAKSEIDALTDKVVEVIAEAGIKLLGRFHRPTQALKARNAKIESEILEIQARQRKIEEKAKVEISQIRADAKKEIERQSRIAKSAEIEIAQHLSEIEKLNEELRFFRRSSVSPKNSITTR